MKKTEKQYVQLRAEEQAMIMLMTQEGKGAREIGHFLKRDPGTVSRELNRDLIPIPFHR